MANEIRITRTGTAPLFVKGELVELNVFEGDEAFKEKDYYIVMVTGHGVDSSSFAGAVVMTGKDDSMIYVGHYANTFTRSAFRRFSGTLEVIQK